jgi:oxygen-independent coproporphyrinogen-3 oxidase
LLPRHLYVHVPFCARRCSYCDFAIAVRARVPVDEYVSALRRELHIRHGDAPLALDTLYFGGGTPSRLGADGVAAAVAAVREVATITPDAEVTLEVNPDDVTGQALDAWAAAGINRLSIGSQSFSDAALAWMHRTHDSAGIGDAVRMARAAGFVDFSLDLIFALPSAVPRSWDEDLDRALALEPTHLSLYGLTVEPHTPLARWQGRGDVSEAPEDRYEEEFLRAHDRLAQAGFRHYEVSNFARPGREARHNSSYWRGVPYAAAGPSAHAFDGRRRRWNVAPYAGWLRALDTGTEPTEGYEELTDANRASETVYLGLRTDTGLTLGDDTERSIVRPWIAAGWATVDDADTLRLTPLGWLRLDSLATVLTAHRTR